jgi:hypothetical protein
MPELTRSIAARLRRYISNRRRAERLRVRLPVSISLLDDRPAKSSRPARSVEGQTLDVSASGLALVVPAIRIGDQYLAGENRRLRISLELPLGPIVIQGTSVRYEQMDESESETGYLIGVNITTMSEPERARYDEYIAGILKK